MNNEQFTAQAMVHSLNSRAEVTIVSHKGNNDVVAIFNGKKYKAVYNVFNGLYYVDDIYGEIK